MVKKDLVRMIYENSDYKLAEITDIVDKLFDCLIEAVKEEKVVINNFGTFERVYREGKEAMNPQTGEKIYVEPGHYLKFTVSRKLKEDIK